MNHLQLVATVVSFAIASFVLFLQWSKAQWLAKVQRFRDKHHGYSTAASHQSNVLFIVSPTSGAGNAMKLYPACLAAMEAKGYSVEVYVTSSANDMITLTQTKDMSHYNRMIAILAGDSSAYEFVQFTLNANNGKWPYAPLLHLPGGFGNVLSGEFHNHCQDMNDIVQQATAVKKGSIIKVTSSGETRFALHNCFDGVQRRFIRAMEERRADLFYSLGTLSLPLIIVYVLAKMVISRNEPALFCVVNSDVEGMGINLGYGITRFDDKMAIVHMPHYKSLWSILEAMQSSINGSYGKQLRAGKVFDGDVIVQVARRYVLEGANHYCLYFDGTSTLSLQGERVILEVVTDAIPYYIMPPTTG